RAGGGTAMHLPPAFDESAQSSSVSWVRAASAAFANPVSTSKNSGDWPRNNPVSVRNLTAPMAAPFVSVGRTLEQMGNFRSRNIVGSGIIRLVENSSPPKGGEFKSGKTSPFVGSVKGGALPALSCQVWKCIASVGPI